MKSQRLVSIYRLVISTIVIIVVVTAIASAVPKSGDSFTVLATVAPQRSVVVDKDLTVLQIYSNTTKDVRPNVYLDKIDGEEVAYSDSILHQYQAIKKSVNFTKPGLVYQKPASGFGSVVRNIVDFFKHLLRL